MKKRMFLLGLGLSSVFTLCACGSSESLLNSYTISRYSDALKNYFSSENELLTSLNSEENGANSNALGEHTLIDYVNTFDICEVKYSNSVDSFINAFYIKNSVISDMKDNYAHAYSSFTGDNLSDGRYIQALYYYKNLQEDDYYIFEFNDEDSIVESIEDYSYCGACESMSYSLTNAKTNVSCEKVYPLLYLKDKCDYFSDYAGTVQLRKGLETEYSYSPIVTRGSGWYGGTSYFGDVKNDGSQKYLYSSVANESYYAGTEYEKVDTGYKVLWTSIFK